MVMICAGSGFAPFRGLIQDRAATQAGGKELGQSLLYFGCDHPEVDWLYKEELKALGAKGVVDLRPSFCKQPQNNWQFVQDRIWQERDTLKALYKAGAHFYLCGDGERLAPAVRDVLARIYQQQKDCSKPDAAEWIAKMERESSRFTADIFA